MMRIWKQNQTWKQNQAREQNQSWKRNGNIWYPAGLVLLLLLVLNHGLDVQAGAAATGDGWLKGRYLALSAVALIAAAGAGAAFFYKGWRLERIFFGIALVLGAMYLYVLPPLSAPDEVRHYISAYELSNRILGTAGKQENGLVLVREEDWFAEDPGGDYLFHTDEDGVLTVEEGGSSTAKVLGQVLTEETYQLIHEKGWSRREVPRAVPDEAASRQVPDRMAYSVHHPVATTPAAYLAPAIGIAAARLLNLNSLWLLYLGRLCNLLLYVSVTYLAMRRLPFGREVLFGVGLLPMTIHLSASFSYDALLMAGIFYFTAVSLHLAFAAGQVRVRDILLLSGIMAAVGPCKMVYAVFMGLCLLIPVKKFGGWKKWALSAACVLGAWALVMIFINGQTVASYAAGTGNYIDWAGEEGYSLSMLLHQPVKTLRLFLNTVIWQGETWHLTMIGAYLGNADPVLDVPYLLVMAFTGALILLALRKPGETLVLTGGRWLWVWALCLICTGALMLSMLLGWTPVSSRIINGVQGRYFLPFLPVLLMTVKNDSVVLTKDCSRTVLYLMVCMDLYVALRIFSTVSMRV